MKSILVVILAVLSFSSSAQDIIEGHRNGKKGDFYFHWGYNRAYYDESDIEFAGQGYSFTLNDVRASDMPEEFDSKVYFNPTKLTIPQFNFRVGYALNDNISISLGWDHMKYKILQDQVVDIDGFIDHSVSDQYGGIYDDNDYIALDRKFIAFEHSDGFNYARMGLEYRVHLLSSKNDKHHIFLFPGISAGAMLPWTDYTIFGTRYLNFVHLAGFGLSTHVSARYEFLNHFFFQIQSQFGYANLTNINLEDHRDARGRQQINFYERSFAFGAYIHSFRK